MSHTASRPDPNVFTKFQQVWSSSICQVLNQISGETFEAQVVDSVPFSNTGEAAGVWMRFSASAGLNGEISFFVSQADALLVSGLLAGKAPNENAEATDDLRETVAAVFRQCVAAASTALKSAVEGEVKFEFSGFEPPSWKPAFGLHLEVSGAETRPVQIFMIADQSMVKSVLAILATLETAPFTSEAAKGIADTAPASHAKDNIDLLWDIQLEATLRFGEREMLLREILDLNSGSVIELDHRVNEPVELLVCGKVVAKGEVVVLGGNYALRVTQVGSPAERMSTLMN